MSDQMPDRFDRSMGQHNVISRPVTIEEMGVLGVGGSQSYIYRVGRSDDGDTIFLKCEIDGRLMKVLIPPAVVTAIDRTRATLTARARSNAAQRAAETRKAKGVVPFQKKAVTR